MQHSQYGQDAFVGDVLFRGRAGVFVDVGARDGVANSNTAYLERQRGWTGIAIEPHPDLFAALQACRTCRCVNAAASDEERAGLEFVRFLEEPLGNSGLLCTFRDPARLQGIRHEIIQVPCVPLSRVLADVPLVHYLDVDVEGHELRVLQGIDFGRVEIRVIGVEASETGPVTEEIDRFLARHGFRPFVHVGADRFYSREALVATRQLQELA